jgi:hypothetical protein
MKVKASLFVLSTFAALVLTLMLVPAQSASAFNSFFNFNGNAPGTSAESIAAPGVHMGSPFIPNSWIVQPNLVYTTMSGNILQNLNCNAALVIELDSVYQDISFRYGITRPTHVLKLDGWLGEPGPGMQVFSTNNYGVDNGGPEGIREGIAAASAAGFDHIVIYSPGGCAAIDDLSLDGSPIVVGPRDLRLVPLNPVPLPDTRLPAVQLPVLEVPEVVIRGN